MYTVHFTTLSNDVPAASRQALTPSSTVWVCRTISPCTNSPVAKSIGGIPETKMNPLALTTGERGTFAFSIASEIFPTRAVIFFISELLAMRGGGRGLTRLRQISTIHL